MDPDFDERGDGMYEVAVIGAGPAGASAAIFTAKAGKRTLLVDDGRSITLRALIRNHYGAPQGAGGVPGPEMVQRGIEHARALGAEYVEGEVREVRREGEAFRLALADGRSFDARFVILCTGLRTELAEAMGLRVAPGREPRVPKRIETDPDGRTGVPGLWAAGTVAGASVHTIVTAGDGARVAINLLSEMAGQRYVDHDVLAKP